jgi:alkylhydroperoxidase/carboxymuconolactone decarboxylase family protein YurZ
VKTDGNVEGPTRWGKREEKKTYKTQRGEGAFQKSTIQQLHCFWQWSLSSQSRELITVAEVISQQQVSEWRLQTVIKGNLDCGKKCSLAINS